MLNQHGRLPALSKIFEPGFGPRLLCRIINLSQSCFEKAQGQLAREVNLID